jgi:signal peptidase II
LVREKRNFHGATEILRYGTPDEPEMRFWKKALLLVAVTTLCVGCDRAAKEYARQHLENAEPRYYLSNVVQLQYDENAGGMLSFGAQLSESVRFYLLTVFVGLCLLMFFLFAMLNGRLHRTQVVGIAMILGGGLGNLSDRLWNNGMVIDFLMLKAGPLHTAVFNLADVSILMGVVVLSVVRSHGAHAPGESVPLE